VVAAGDGGTAARHSRTPLPDRATRARNQSAFRSLAEGIVE
jgi:hypothetical protein